MDTIVPWLFSPHPPNQVKQNLWGPDPGPRATFATSCWVILLDTEGWELLWNTNYSVWFQTSSISFITFIWELVKNAELKHPRPRELESTFNKIAGYFMAKLEKQWLNLVQLETPGEPLCPRGWSPRAKATKSESLEVKSHTWESFKLSPVIQMCNQG